MILFLTLTQGSIYLEKLLGKGLVMQGRTETALSEYSCDHGLPHHLETSMVFLNHQAEAPSDGPIFPDWLKQGTPPVHNNGT